MERDQYFAKISMIDTKKLIKIGRIKNNRISRTQNLIKQFCIRVFVAEKTAALRCCIQMLFRKFYENHQEILSESFLQLKKSFFDF